MSGRDKKTKGNGEGQLPDYKDNVRGHTNEDYPLPDYKDQVHGRSLAAQRHDITGQNSNRSSSINDVYNFAFHQNVYEFENNHHQSLQPPVASGSPQVPSVHHESTVGFDIGENVVVMTKGPWQGKTGRVVKLHPSGIIFVCLGSDSNCRAFKASSLQHGTQTEYDGRPEGELSRTTTTNTNAASNTLAPTMTMGSTQHTHMDEEESEVDRLRKENAQLKEALKGMISLLTNSLGIEFVEKFTMNDNDGTEEELG